MTSSKDLGEITLSTFRGEDGPLVKEVRKVVDWFQAHGTPDVILAFHHHARWNWKSLKGN